MRLFRAKSEPERLLDTIADSFAAVGRADRSRLLKAGLIAGGVAALTAGSAAVSSIRRRMDGGES